MKAAVLQMESSPDVARNLQRAEALLKEAARRGASLAVLPEGFATGYDAVPWEEGAEGPGGPAQATLARASSETGMHVVGGVLVRAGGSLRNSAMLAAPKGGIVARYDKRFLWGGERKVFSPGSHPVVRGTPLGAVGLLVCYDLEFPEASRDHLRAGVAALAAPAAFFTGSIFDLVTRARALENACFVLAAGYAPPRFCGHSRIVAPDGQVLAEVAEGEGLAVAEVDPAAYTAWREGHPYRRDLLATSVRGL